MTRFARAKGSKSSNERAPEDSTPWEVMKEQLLQAKKENEESKKRKEAEQKRIENYENFLKDRKVQKRAAAWCDFPEVPTQKPKVNNNCAPNESSEPSAKKKKKNKKKSDQNIVQDDNKGKPEVQNNVSSESPKKPKNKKKKKSEQTPQNLETSQASTSETTPDNVIEKPSNEQQNKQKKNKNKNKQNTSNKASNVKPNNDDAQNVNGTQNNNQPKPNSRQQMKKKEKKLVDGKPVRRKEINDRSFQLIVHGKEIELVRFDGFPIMQKDAERLEDLKNSMIKKGIPKSEVQRTMKLERRRAEKALARMKREVCYNCRKGGHVLSDCPELKSKIPGAEAGDGVCFKCGSTEHRQFECKVQKSSEKEFRFATCFICKEPGHIARQCPDNPKGLYPNGGCCKLCGDVTHLRKDCPTVNEKKEESNFKLQTFASNDGIEDVGMQNNKLVSQEPSKKPKKIKF